MDILSQAKSGMGKTAVFVLATLQQIEPVDGQVTTLANQWNKETLDLDMCEVKESCLKCSVLTSTFQVSVLVMCHTRELAFQISKEYERFSKFLPAVKVRIVVLLSWLLGRGPKMLGC